MEQHDGFWEQITSMLREFFGGFFKLFRLSTQEDSAENRLQKLRFIYFNDPKANIKYRRVKDVLRGHIDPVYYPYYERILSAERAVYNVVKNLHSGARGDELLEQMQNLGLKVANLIELLQNADQVRALYKPDSEEARMVMESRQWLEQRIEEALEIHAGVPARVMSFTTVATGRGVDKLSERIARLVNRLDDIADAYADLDNYVPEHLQNLMEDETLQQSD